MPSFSPLASQVEPASLLIHSSLDLHRNSNYKIGISMKLRSLVIGLLVISSLFTANAQSGDDGKDLNALEGTWRLAAGQIGATDEVRDEGRNQPVLPYLEACE
jgi:hypothetical protein